MIRPLPERADDRIIELISILIKVAADVVSGDVVVKKSKGSFLPEGFSVITKAHHFHYKQQKRAAIQFVVICGTRDAAKAARASWEKYNHLFINAMMRPEIQNRAKRLYISLCVSANQ